MSGLTEDQVIELKHGLSGIAELSWTFFQDLRGQGFDNGQALKLTQTWVATVLSMSSQGDPE